MSRDFPCVAVVCLLFLCCSSGVSHKCLTDRQDVKHKRHLYMDSRSWPITIESSDRASHLLVSHIVKILFTEVLGYARVHIKTGYNTPNTTEILNRLSGCDGDRCGDGPIRRVPDTMLNIEVWSPAGYNIEPWVNEDLVKDCGPLGPFGRFGWYMPTWLVDDYWGENSEIISHWRALHLPDVTNNFHLENDLDLLMSFLTKSDLKNQQSYCTDKNCHNGFLPGNTCSKIKNTCAMLLSGYPEQDSGILKKQVQTLNLDVSVAWIGEHLNRFVQQKTQQLEPTLFFNWVPNTLTVMGNFTRVSLPACDVGRESTGSCDFDVHQLSKITWSKLETHAPEAYHVISNLHFTQQQYEDMLRLFIEHNPQLINSVEQFEEAACLWIKNNKDLWNKWIPPNLPNRTTIYLGGMFPLSGPFWRQPGIVPGAQMAIDMINMDTSILKDYQLELKVVDTQCKGDIAMKQFMQLINNDTHPIAGVIGPGCSETAEPIAGIAKHFHTIVVSYSAEALALSNRNLFPLFFRTAPSMSQYMPVMIDIFKKYNWEQVALVAEDGQEFPEFKNFFKHSCLNNDIKVIYDRKIPRQTSVEDARKYMTELKKTEAKIIVLTSFEKTARAVLCNAYKMGMIGREGYVWFLPIWFTQGWWNTTIFNVQQKENVPCTEAEMLEAIQGHITLGSGFFGSDTEVIVSNITVYEWVFHYVSFLKAHGMEEYWSSYASYAHDAVWAFALGLDALLSEDPSALESLHTESTTKQLMHHLDKTKFMGVSGPLHFVGAERKGITNIMEFIGNQSTLIGRYTPEQNNTNKLVLNESAVIWPSGKLPKDGRPEPVPCSIEPLRAALGITCYQAIVTANVLGIALFLLAVAILLIYVKRSYDKKVKATRDRMEELGLMQDNNWRTLDQWEVPRDRIVLNRKLGEGAFGTVYGGEAFIEDRWIGVAVKTLKVGSNPEEKLDFLSEAEMMKRFDHENIVKLQGVCTRGEPAYTIMEFMLHGDLKTFLVARRQLVGQNSKESEDVTPERLTAMARDIDCGLKYLTDKKFVHRDLACRNCLVHANKVVKIGDFGMTRPMYDSDYYRFNKRGMLPVRWMAPESLTDGLFTAASDMWSFGVLLYEIMTFGSFPYQGLSNKQVLEAVKSGQTIALPTNCSEELQEVITACWSYDPEARPTVDHMLDLLSNSPFLVQPCLDAPMTVLPTEVTDSLDIELAPNRPRCRPRSHNEPAQLRHSMASCNHAGRFTMSADPMHMIEPLTTNIQPKRFSATHQDPMYMIESTSSNTKRFSVASVIRGTSLANFTECDRWVSVPCDDADCPLTNDDGCVTEGTDSGPVSPNALTKLSSEERADSDYGSDNSKESAHLTSTSKV